MAKKSVSIVVSVVIAVSAAAAGWVIIQTGHSGAKASWCEVTKNCPVSSGVIPNDGDDDEG